MLPELRFLAKSLLISGGSQNFLGARWVPAVLKATPWTMRQSVALRLLALSPHYFYGPVHKEAARVKRTRDQLAEEVLAPYLSEESSVLDYGCGPGYLAKSVAARARRVDAVDISAGTIACAKAINAANNLRYLTVDSFRLSSELYDVAYSFAVIQHVGDDVFKDILALVYERLKSSGRLLFHVVIDGAGWKTETQWRNDRSLRGRVKLRYGLNCFSRDQAAVQTMVTSAGFRDTRIVPMSSLTSVMDDVARQHLIIAVKP